MREGSKIGGEAIAPDGKKESEGCLDMLTVKEGGIEAPNDYCEFK